MALAAFINLAIHGGPEEAGIVLGCCFLTQWMTLQLPLWGLKAGFRLRLRAGELGSYDPQEWQFGIRQLLIITTIVGVLFGIARLVIKSLPSDFSFVRGEAAIFLFLAVSAVIFSLPLLLAALLQRGVTLGVFIALLLVGMGTYLETPVLGLIIGASRRPNFYDLLSINVCTSAFILIVALSVRLSGYRLSRQQERQN